MEACLNYHSTCDIKRKQFKFTGKSGSKWTLIEKWVPYQELPYNTINIQKASSGIHRFYYADVEVYTLDGMLVLEKVRKGSSTDIEVRIDLVEISLCLYNMKYRDTQLCDKKAMMDTFLYKIRLFPVLELRSAEKFGQERRLRKQALQSLVCDLSTLITDNELHTMYDIVLISDTVTVKAHKSVISARLPEFCDRLNNPLLRRKQDGLEIVKLDSAAAPGLSEIVLFTYTTEYSTSLLSTSNLSIAAKEMGVVELQCMFLDELMNKLSLDSVLYIIYITDIHGEREYHVKSLSFLLSHMAQVVHIPAWDSLEVLFTCLSQAGSRTCESGDFTALEILRLSLYMVSLARY